jgi:hypothetical protein
MKEVLNKNTTTNEREFHRNHAGMQSRAMSKDDGQKAVIVRNENDFTIIHSRLFASIRGEWYRGLL